MIDETIQFLREHLGAQLKRAYPAAAVEAPELLKFAKYEEDGIKLHDNAISLLLLNLEEERVLRGPDLYSRVTEDGSRARVQPELRLYLTVLFVAHFPESRDGASRYPEAWRYLSVILRSIQSQSVFDAQSAPSLPAGIEKLVLELLTLKLAEQNEVWNALRLSHHPSLLYRVKLLAFADQPLVAAPPITEIDASVTRIR